MWSQSVEKGRRVGTKAEKEDEVELAAEGGGCYRRISERTLALWMEVG